MRDLSVEIEIGEYSGAREVKAVVSVAMPGVPRRPTRLTPREITDLAREWQGDMTAAGRVYDLLARGWARLAGEGWIPAA